MSLLSWFKKQAAAIVPPPPALMEITPGAEYIMEMGNPFQTDPRVRVVAVQAGWVRYQFIDFADSTFQHTKEQYFRHCYKRLKQHEPQGERSDG